MSEYIDHTDAVEALIAQTASEWVEQGMDGDTCEGVAKQFRRNIGTEYGVEFRPSLARLKSEVKRRMPSCEEPPVEEGSGRFTEIEVLDTATQQDDLRHRIRALLGQNDQIEIAILRQRMVATGEIAARLFDVIERTARAEYRQQEMVTHTSPLEDECADEFVRTKADEFRFNHTRKKWMTWNGWKWIEDEKNRARYEMRLLVKAVRQNETDARAIRDMGKASFTNGALSAATCHPDIAVVENEFDAYPELLNTPDGIYNLKTGDRQDNDPMLLMLRATNVAPDFDMDTPIFDKFLKETFQGVDEDKIEFLQKRLGYACSGLMEYEDFDFWHGGGGNGKGTLMNSVTNCLGDYHVTAPETAFISDERGRTEHSTELAGLKGARLVTLSETKKGQYFNMKRIKEFTGRDAPITARFLFKDFFIFWPTFKLVVIANDPPRFPKIDPALKRRLHVTHFWRKPNKTETKLKDNLMAEYAGIMAWLIRGAKMAIEKGFEKPNSVEFDTAELLKDQDDWGRFWAECVEKNSSGRISRKDIAEVYEVWADEGNAFIVKMTSHKVSENLTAMFGREWPKVNHKGTIMLNGYRFREDILKVQRDRAKKRAKNHRLEVVYSSDLENLADAAKREKKE